MIPRKDRIRAAFSAAVGYDAVARPQERVAAGLAARLAALPPLPAGARVLEVGCGTGLLTRHLPPALGATALGAGAAILATDLSPAMAVRARARLGGGGPVVFAAMDAEAPALPAGSVDLIVSSLAAQWFLSLPSALAGLARLLVPGGRMVLTVPGAGSFAEWAAAHDALGLRAGTPAFCSATALLSLAPAGGAATVESERFVENHADGLAFARGLAALGADTPRPGHRPLGPGDLRRVIARLGAPCPMTWVVHTFSFVKEGARP